MDVFDLIMPLARRLPPEMVHRTAIRAMRAGLLPLRRAPRRPDPLLATTLWGLDFANPIGFAAGLDKSAEAVDPLLALGAGHVEVGTVTPRAQAGNPLPRLFRLPAAQALINRNGFANDGLEAVARRLGARLAGGRRAPGVVGVNIGINTACADALADFEAGVRGLAALADYLVINVSSPNTPGLRDLQAHDRLAAVMRRARAALAEACPLAAPPLLVKIAPDLDEAELAAVVDVVFAHKIDGMIVANTTVGRPARLSGRHSDEAGGLSGHPLYALSTEVLRRVYGLTGGRIPLIGVGGVSSGHDAYRKIRAGASLVQFYTALAYQGPGLARRMTAELARLLAADGFSSVAEAVGVDVVERHAAAA